jgi:SHS2 domain-containing protein
MFEIFDHTADLGIRIRADELDELFADAGRGLFSLLVTNPDLVQPEEEATFRLRAGNLEELLHDWLSELLYTFYAKRLVLADFRVHVSRGAAPELTATASSEPTNPDRHEIGAEVKAITWHGLKVEELLDGWEAEVIVDL